MRVVSLCPSLTELVARVGRGDALVGRTRFCVEPPELVARVPVVGGTKDPDVARIVASAPDLVLLNEEENRREDHAALVAAGLRCHTSLPRSVRDACAVVRSVAAVLGAGAAGERLAATIEALDAELAERAGSLPPVPFAYLVWRRPWMAAGPGTYVDGLLAHVGGRNVVGAAPGSYPVVELASLRGAERVLLASEPYRFGERHRAEVARAAGLALEDVLPVDGQALSWHGARTLEGLAAAWNALREGPARPPAGPAPI